MTMKTTFIPIIYLIFSIFSKELPSVYKSHCFFFIFFCFLISAPSSTKTLVMHIVDVGLDYYKLGPSAAMGTILMIILLIITSLQLSILRKDYK